MWSEVSVDNKTIDSDCLLMLCLLKLFLVDRLKIGQEDDAEPPEPFEWDPNEE